MRLCLTSNDLLLLLCFVFTGASHSACSRLNSQLNSRVTGRATFFATLSVSNDATYYEVVQDVHTRIYMIDRGHRDQYIYSSFVEMDAQAETLHVYTLTGKTEH
jgi:hypothetical protein